MELIKKEITLKKYSSIDDLSSEEKNLLIKAREAIKTSYAPYSKFHVGCAVLLQNDEIVLGSNQENSAYPSGLCAERVAIFSAGANFPNQAIKMMAITAQSDDYPVTRPIASCGACLQSISEYEMKFNSPIQFILQGENGDIYTAESVKSFLPFTFFLNELKK